MSCGCDVASAGYVRKYCDAHQAQIRSSYTEMDMLTTLQKMLECLERMEKKIEDFGSLLQR